MLHSHSQKDTMAGVHGHYTITHSKDAVCSFCCKISHKKNQNSPPSDSRWTSMDNFWASFLLLPTPLWSSLLLSAPLCSKERGGSERSMEDQEGSFLRVEQRGSERSKGDQRGAEKGIEEQGGLLLSAPPCSSPWSCSHVYSIIQPLKSAWIWPGQMFEPCI